MQYDLEDRTLKFSKDLVEFIRKVNQDIPNSEISKQLVRASGSVGANYIEAKKIL